MSGPQVTQSLADSQEYSSMAGEVWKPVPSEPGVLASNMGRILQAPSYTPMANGGFRANLPTPRYGQTSRAKKTAKHTYKIIMLRREREGGARQSPRKVHQLVCEAFHGPKPFPEAVVIHKDEDALNNQPGNLKWGTQKENLNAPKFKASKILAPLERLCDHCGDMFRRDGVAQRFCSRTCSTARNSVLSGEKVQKAIEMLEAGTMQKDVATALGVSKSVIQRLSASRQDAPEWRV